MTDAEMNKKYAEPIKAVLAAMEKDFEEFTGAGFLNNEEATEKFYANRYYFGYGNPESGIRWAEFYMCPEADECMEVSLTNLLDFINEEYPKDKLTRSEHFISYISESGRHYEVTEWKVPNSARTYDIGAVLYDDGTADPGCFKVLDYFYGITTMDDAELLEWCRKIVGKYEKENF